ncbi:MAG TPA: GGDEF domain-containing protein [Coriobacteriia bacterium]|nr:GGDEF domain-containing protein [Coriobacteriia bacterium]
MSDRRPMGLHLAWLLSVGATSVFVTVLIAITGDLSTLWPLYIIPIVIAALAYEVAGAVMAVAGCTALVALLIYSTGVESVPVRELFVGALAYTVSGLVIGVQAHSYRQQRDLLQVDSIRDAVTDTFTAEHLASLLAEEVRRAERYDVPCTFTVVEPIGFEELRRTYGRIRAEQLLGRLAQVLRLCARDTDVIGRYGADSFGLILPFTGDTEAKLVADRIEAAVRATEFEGDALEPTIHCPIVIASATCPTDSCEVDEVIAAIRDRLTRATCTVQPERPPHGSPEAALPEALS